MSSYMDNFHPLKASGDNIWTSKSLKFSHSNSGKPLGYPSVFTAFLILFFGIGVASILFGLEKLSTALGLECFIFDNYRVTGDPAECLGNDWSKLLITKDEEISALTNRVSFLKNQLTYLKNGRKSVDSAWNWSKILSILN